MLTATIVLPSGKSFTQTFHHESERIIWIAELKMLYERKGIPCPPVTKGEVCGPVQRRNIGCDFCQNADFGSFRAEVEKCGDIIYARISLADGSGRFPTDEQFRHCPQCGVQLATQDTTSITSVVDADCMDCPDGNGETCEKCHVRKLMDIYKGGLE